MIHSNHMNESVYTSNITWLPHHILMYYVPKRKSYFKGNLVMSLAILNHTTIGYIRLLIN
jgi:hypothetical protein